ncbi:MAG: phosphoglycerate mutase (2,3-diphosphoglycerate-independent) [Crocinitomicaceae bacterium]|nr:phosphoglycerate mutase (2,3-diphosphoglycerate-independent) [Crocinitomicaceae bacterium]
MKNEQKCALIILDGWGIGSTDDSNAIEAAHTPFMDALLAEHPKATLRTDGEFVGLPVGQMGNSEVGHMNIGAGRVVYQDLLRINRAIADDSFQSETILNNAFEVAKKRESQLHFMGLVSQGGVHSQQEHLHALCRAAAVQGINDFAIHAFTDGRDTSPQKALSYMENLGVVLAETGGRIASVHGRYYSMDRDNRWERIAQSYATLVRSEGECYPTVIDGIQAQYDNGITDEFIRPFTVGAPLAIEPNDVVICFNFRTDRCREITQVLTQRDMPEHNTSVLPLHYVTMTNYDDSFKGVHVIYDKPNLEGTLGQSIAEAGRTQVRIAETEKYPHVTFFFNGGREVPFNGEQRLMAHSPKVATYDLQPEMSAHDIVGLICPEMKKPDPDSPDFICLNFANPDMVGHTGVFDAIVSAVETTDACLKEVVEVGRANGYQFIIIADHGNADFARHPDGSPHTAHTTNPVPVVVLSEQVTTIDDGKLADVAPTILKMMQIDQPSEMTGSALY